MKLIKNPEVTHTLANIYKWIPHLRDLKAGILYLQGSVDSFSLRESSVLLSDLDFHEVKRALMLGG